MSEIEKIRRRHGYTLIACGVLVAVLLGMSAWRIGHCDGKVERIGMFSWRCT